MADAALPLAMANVFILLLDAARMFKSAVVLDLFSGIGGFLAAMAYYLRAAPAQVCTPFLLSGRPGGTGPRVAGGSRGGAALRIGAAPSADAYLNTASPPGALAGGGAGTNWPMGA
ncbi:hypothetical protein TUZN_1560 [Thermoproteus uzoniensis 768-20]|uniref:Uncharacterized protein n=1 Tax=Thermoproteus uzoniensis (strain 768-20) TaxID=999630 RepID=F2L2I0_THEU7|nr:hypothetical protein TUZN_1560 [Thermoproteus uzoniensis 768-20]